MSEVNVAPERGIDEDRGIVCRFIKDLNMEVYMYVDSPGYYYNVHGNALPESMAGRAGFDVERLGRNRQRQEKMQVARAAIDRELGSAGNERIVVEERGGYRIVSIGGGRHILEDADGHNLTQGTHLPLAMAKSVLADLSPETPAKGPGLPLRPNGRLGAGGGGVDGGAADKAA